MREKKSYSERVGRYGVTAKRDGDGWELVLASFVLELIREFVLAHDDISC